MCGIAGIFDLNGITGTADIQRMTNAMRHRGPNDEGFLAVDTRAVKMAVSPLAGSESAPQDLLPIERCPVNSNLQLGHRRLSILDLSPSGHQPMCFGDLWIVFNGEVFNYIELRHELQQLDYRFSTGTDTEVILAAYDYWGEDCVNHFNGDWAFCILDTAKRQLFLSRDRYGVKPLFYYCNKDGQLAFASEISALQAIPMVPCTLDRATGLDYLSVFCSDSSDQSFFAGIKRLQQAHSMRVDLRSGQYQIWRYYDVPKNDEIGRYDHKQAERYAAEIRDLLIDSVRLRLRADVPVGTCLSGGLDSSAIATIMHKLLREQNNETPQHTFTASFPGTSIDESAYARKIIDRIQATSHFIYPTEDGYRNRLVDLLRHQQEPFPGTSIYAQWEVMQHASKYVTVILDGQAGDEVLAGYRNYRTSFLAHLLTAKRLISFVTECVSTISHAGGIRNAIADVKSLPFFLLGRDWKRKIFQRRYRKQLEFALEELGCDTRTDRTRSLDNIERLFSPNVNEVLQTAMTQDILPRLLRLEDRNSMAHSIEARLPFTDYRLVDYAFQIPAIFKIHNGWTKWLLRLAMRDLLPDEIVWRRDKLGFAAPNWGSRQQLWVQWKDYYFTNAANKIAA